MASSVDTWWILESVNSGMSLNPQLNAVLLDFPALFPALSFGLSHLFKTRFVFVYMCDSPVIVLLFYPGTFHLHPPLLPSFGSRLGFFLPWIPHSLVIQAQSLAPYPSTKIMNEKPCCSLQIAQAASVSQIRMEATAGQRGGMMDSPHSKSSMPTGSFLNHKIGREAWAFP